MEVIVSFYGFGYHKFNYWFLIKMDIKFKIELYNIYIILVEMLMYNFFIRLNTIFIHYVRETFQFPY